MHWSAEVFSDFDELKKNMDGTDDLTIERAIETMVNDVNGKGMKLDDAQPSLCTIRSSSAPSTPHTTSVVLRSTREEAPLSAFQLA